jgi:hypothetical protein
LRSKCPCLSIDTSIDKAEIPPVCCAFETAPTQPMTMAFSQATSTTKVEAQTGHQHTHTEQATRRSPEFGRSTSAESRTHTFTIAMTVDNGRATVGTPGPLASRSQKENRTFGCAVKLPRIDHHRRAHAPEQPAKHGQNTRTRLNTTRRASGEKVPNKSGTIDSPPAGAKTVTRTKLHLLQPEHSHS